MNLDWLHDYVARWHDTWEVVGAIATTMAVFIALAGIAHERKISAEERRRAVAAETERDSERASHRAIEAERNLAERRQQATGVVAFPRFVETRQTLAGPVGHWQIVLGNYSPAPIFDVEGQGFAGQMLDCSASTSAIPPGGTAIIRTTVTDPNKEPRGVMKFRDAAGVRWKRLASGDLYEVDQNGNELHRC